MSYFIKGGGEKKGRRMIAINKHLCMSLVTLLLLALCSNKSGTRSQPGINRAPKQTRTQHKAQPSQWRNLAFSYHVSTCVCGGFVCVHTHTLRATTSCALKHRSCWFPQIGMGFPVVAACPLKTLRSLLGSLDLTF